MNLNQLQQEPTAQPKGTKAQVKEQAQEDAQVLLDVLNNSTTESAYWDRKRPLTDCDVVAIVVRPCEYNGETATWNDGTVKYEFVLTLVEPNGLKKYVTAPQYSKLYKAISAAMLEFDVSLLKFAQVLGLNISVECTGKDGNAYTFAAKVNGKAKGNVEGIFDKNGNQIVGGK